MVVDEFDIFRASNSPDEAETPLRIDADTVLFTTIADEPLQPIARRNPEILHILRGMDQLELPQRRPLHVAVNALDVLLMPDPLGVVAPERPDHVTSI